VQPIELLVVLLDLVDAGVYRPHPRSDEQQLLLRNAVFATGGEGWQKMMARLETKSWRRCQLGEIVCGWDDRRVDLGGGGLG
jgi:hypothetical protein